MAAKKTKTQIKPNFNELLHSCSPTSNSPPTTFSPPTPTHDVDHRDDPLIVQLPEENVPHTVASTGMYQSCF